MEAKVHASEDTFWAWERTYLPERGGQKKQWERKRAQKEEWEASHPRGDAPKCFHWGSERGWAL